MQSAGLEGEVVGLLERGFGDDVSEMPSLGWRVAGKAVDLCTILDFGKGGFALRLSSLMIG